MTARQHAVIMCNDHRQRFTRKQLRDAYEVLRDLSDNAPDQGELFPTLYGPVIRLQDGKRVMSNARWGLPSSSQAQFIAATTRADKLRAKGKEFDFKELMRMEPDGGTTNVRNTESKHWKPWLGPAYRCLVPWSSFAEPTKTPDGTSANAWFALDESLPLASFAGIWIPQQTRVWKMKEGETTTDCYAFLTTEPNTEVAPIHPMAMPVILSSPEEEEIWLKANWEEAKSLQRPLPTGSLKSIHIEPLAPRKKAEPPSRGGSDLL